jgi:hypothetical protein
VTLVATLAQYNLWVNGTEAAAPSSVPNAFVNLEQIDTLLGAKRANNNNKDSVMDLLDGKQLNNCMFFVLKS